MARHATIEGKGGEVMKNGHASDAVQMRIVTRSKELERAFDRVTRCKERVVLMLRDGSSAALISLEDLEFLKEMECDIVDRVVSEVDLSSVEEVDM
jgi:hypothetical protein